jgi:hypothetical protein
MGVSRFLMAAAVSGVVAVSASSSADADEQCLLGSKYPVSSVEPYRTNQNTGGYGDGYQPVLRGADIKVPAQPGLTAEWLERQVQGQVTAGVCQFGVGAVAVEVLPMGDDFVVRVKNTNYRIGTHDERPGNEILRRANELPHQ